MSAAQSGSGSVAEEPSEAAATDAMPDKTSNSPAKGAPAGNDSSDDDCIFAHNKGVLPSHSGVA